MNLERFAPAKPPGERWTLIMTLSLLPLFFVYAWLGDPGRGRAAFVAAMSITTATRFNWSLRSTIWFWLLLLLFTIVYASLVVLVPWPDTRLSYLALLPFGFAAFAVVNYSIKLTGKFSKRSHDL